MKRYFLLAILFYLIPFSNSLLKAQNFVPFPLPGAEWRFVVYNYNNPMGGIDGYYNNIIEGDTTIGNYTYKKLMQTGTTTSEFAYVGGIRQDQESGKVYIKFKDSSFCGEQDTLLYDFGLQIGDTLTQCPEILGGELLTVDFTDSVYIGGYWLKRIHTNSLTILIEGIGSTSSLQNGWGGWEFGYIELWCFALNGQPVYPDSTCLITGVNSEWHETKNIILVYPNPSNTGVIHFRYNNIDQYQNKELKCFDVYGKEVHTEVVYRFQGESEIDIANWQAGVYFVIVYSDGKAVGEAKFVAL